MSLADYLAEPGGTLGAIQAPEWGIQFCLGNETLLDVSPKGRFDLIEHAHMIQGPSATGPRPLVSGVFGLPSTTPTTGEFGVGEDLPDIDED